jgi:hypothetical protein
LVIPTGPPGKRKSYVTRRILAPAAFTAKHNV